MSNQTDSEKVKDYFDQWNLYQKIINFNYMVHNEIFEVLRQFFDANFHQPFSLLDLGCGDAFYTARLLKDTHIARYVGVDLSETALGYANKNMDSISCEKVFIEGNLMEVVRDFQARFDVIIAGYSIHHLTLEEKDAFFGHCCTALKPKGQFLAYDIVRHPHETREAYLKRQWAIYKNNWTELTKEELMRLHDHIFANDYPESIDTLDELAKHNGFKHLKSLFKERNNLFELCCFST
ncbi:MAG: ubiquinone biosynthesis protein UbiE [Candidatus Parabeggiatoa sp. nov. 3]|nr:MAG: ubiquinone biosynthesis protein UbiE [Gammaproteobacteria bacterium]